MATDYQSLATLATNYASLSGVSTFRLLKLALLKNIAATVAPSVATDYQSLISSANVAGYASAGLAVDLAGLLELALLQIIANNVGSGGGGSGNVTFGNYGGTTPGFTPTTSTLALDTSNQTIWAYDSGTWHLIV